MFAKISSAILLLDKLLIYIHNMDESQFVLPPKKHTKKTEYYMNHLHTNIENAI